MPVLVSHTFQPTLTPGKHWSALHNHSYVFSRMSYEYKWSPVLCNVLRLVCSLSIMALRLTIGHFIFIAEWSLHCTEALCFFIPLPMKHIWVVFNFWWLCIMLLLTFSYKSLCGHIFSFFLDITGFRSGIVGPYGKFIFHCIRSSQTSVCAFPGIAPSV